MKGVMFREAGPGICECGGSSTRGCREIGEWNGARNHPQSLLGGRRWGTELAGPGLLAAIEWGEQGEEGDVSGPRDGVSVTVRDRLLEESRFGSSPFGRPL